METRKGATEPIRILIAALGGEGGGVLAAWLQTAAIAEGHFIQGTSVPGVAQRTGSTTYYMEIVPGAGTRHAMTHTPVLALNAAPGEVDLLVGSELLEAVRMVSGGFVTSDRTTLIASTARVYTVDEKSAMGDGRLDAAKLANVARTFARTAVVGDFAAEAASTASPISSVLLGAIAGTGLLPIQVGAYREAIRREGKSVDSNLRGFEAGLSLALALLSPPKGASRPVLVPALEEARAPLAPLGVKTEHLPSEIRDIVGHAHARLSDYQDEAYARSYLEIVTHFARLPNADPPFLREFARHLAVRMSVEDVIRVAQLKLREARLSRVAAEAKAASGDIVDVTEYLKPGPEEICGLLPVQLGTWLEQRLPRDKAWPMTVRTTRLSGYLRLKVLASLRRWRPSSLRSQRERQWRTDWLSLVEQTLAIDARAAQEVAALAGLVRGYGATYTRGWTSYSRIVEELVHPMLNGKLPPSLFADAVLQARLAATKDPEGQTLSAVLASVRKTTSKAAAE